MLTTISDALRWLLSETGPTLVVLGLLGFIFREKWRQLLSRSLGQELERLKHELTKEQQTHAASLAPQLEAIRHDFQKELASYKTSLIAQAEEVKLKSDLKKSLGTKYLEIKFARLMTLEEELARCGWAIQYFVSYEGVARQQSQPTEALELLQKFADSVGHAEMFLSPQERQTLTTVRMTMARMLNHVGPDKPHLPLNGPEATTLLNQRQAAEQLVRQKIHQLAGV